MSTLHSFIPLLRFSEFDSKQAYVNFENVIESTMYGPRFNANDYDVSGNVKTIRGTDVNRSGELNYNQVPIAKLDIKTVNHHALKDGDLVMITTADCGLTGVFREQMIPYISSAYGIRIRLNAKGYPEYFKYFFQTNHAKREVASYIRKATVANLPGSDVLKIKLNLPDLVEQQKIATFLSAVDEKINLLQKKKEGLEQYKKGVMQQLFSQKLRFKKEDGSDFPDWEENKLGDLCSIKTGKLDANAMVENGDYRFYTCAKDYYRIDQYAFDTEALLISGNGANVGYIHYYKGKFNAYQRTYVLDSFVQDIQYIKYFLDKNLYERIRNEKKEGNTPYIVLGTLKEMVIAVPNLMEQTKISNFLNNIDNKITFVETQLGNTKQFKKGLLQQMFV